MRTLSLGGGATPRATAPPVAAIRRWPLELPRVAAVRTIAAAAGLATVFALVRVVVALSPPLRETYYDEALTGLMSLDILRGVPQVFYWGQPYLGAVDAYLAAAAFRLFGPSTLALRLGIVWVSVLWVWAAWRIGRSVAGEGWGVLAGLQIALPPIFLTFVQLSSHAEGVALVLGTLTLAAAVRLVEPLPGRRQEPAWVLLGLAAGLAWWTSPMVAMLLGASAAGLLVARPAVLAGPGPYAALALSALASLPFWLWNARHEWATFHHLLTWGGALPGVTVRVHNVAGALVEAVRDTYWDSHAVPLPVWASGLGWIVVGAVYVPAVGLAASRLVVWSRRLIHRERPWREPLDLVALAFWLTVAAHLLTWFGTSGIMRYSLTFFGPLPLLVTAVLARLARLGRAGRGAALALAGALLTFNLVTHVAFVRAGATAPVRPVDAVIERLQALGATACYADSRIAQVITFESGGRIVCSDFYGLRNFDLLRTVDRVDDPARVAIVSRPAMDRELPAELAEGVRRTGGGAAVSRAGDYVIFHDFVPPDPRIRPIPSTGWRARASAATEDAALAFDRRVWTRWTAPRLPGEWLELDLGRIQPVTQVSLLAAPDTADAPLGLRVETSRNREHWQTAASAGDVLSGLHWWKGHPRLDDSGRIIVRFAPRESRYVRLTDIGAPARGGEPWSVSELFVYEPAETLWAPPPAAVAGLSAAARELDHWMDDPTGPNPSRAPVTAEHRRAQVRWGAALTAANEALAAAPEWEAAHHTYARALSWAGWGRGPEWLLDRSDRDGAWQEVARLAELIAARPDAAWRAGRDAAWARALDHLGRSSEAAALRARPAPVPGRSVRIRFGKELELVGVDAPPVVRPGDTVRLAYHWRLLEPTAYDYWVFLHVAGLPGGGNHDGMVGEYGSSNWAAGERVRQVVTFTVPADTAPGAYPLRVGVWLPWSGRRLHILASDVPQAHRAASLGSLVVAR
jgi:hypothetical protein